LPGGPSSWSVIFIFVVFFVVFFFLCFFFALRL